MFPFILVLLVLSSITLFSKNSGKYTIRKRMNYSGIWILKFFLVKQKPFHARIKLDKSFEVKTEGVQKIFGIGNLNHHKNSDRYGLIYDGDGKFGIYSYQYRNGSRSQWYRLGTVRTDETFYIRFDNYIVSRYKIGRYLYPYFEQDGDDELGAPHNMTMSIYFNEDFEELKQNLHLQQFNLLNL